MSKLETLESLMTASKTDLGYTFLKPAQYKPVVKDDHCQINEAIKNAEGMIACAITPSGIAFLASLDAPKPANVSTFAIKTAPIPVTKRAGGAGRPSKYPFEKLEVGQYFFVPDTAKQPEPAKSLGSVVNSANHKYATVVEGETRKNRKGEMVPKLAFTRKFIVRPFSETDDAGELIHGAGVWREA